MSTIADLVIKLSVNDTASKDVERAGSKITGSLKGIAKTAGWAAGGAALGGLFLTVKTGIGEWEESTKVQAQTEAVLKSTGMAANVTAGHISNLAGTLLKKSGVDDEAIQSGANLLLTFTDIRNEVGAGNDVFDQTTKTMLDMSVALGQDTSSSALQLGKALNDPIKGVTALQRVGVTFTEGQRTQIKAMVDAGNTMGAQKLILRELNKEFGGSAEAVGKTLPGQLAIAKEAFNNFAGMVVGKVVPALASAVSFVHGHWPEIQATLEKVFAAVKPTLVAVADLAKAIADVIRDNWPAISKVATTMADIVKNSLRVVTDALRLVTDLLKGDWGKAWGDAKKLVVDILDGIYSAIKNASTLIGRAALALGGAFAGGIVSGMKSLGEDLTGLVKGALNSVIDVFNGFEIPGAKIHIPVPFAPDINFTTPKIALPNVPKLAIGTNMVNEPGLAWLHRGEAVVPAAVAGGGYSGAGGINIERMEVRSETDVRLVARELARRLGA